MRCAQCEREFGSQWFFPDAERMVCRECLEKEATAGGGSAAAATPFTESADAREHRVAGRALRCPICGGGRFWTRIAQLSAPGKKAADASGLGREAECYVCEACRHLLMFHPR